MRTSRIALAAILVLAGAMPARAWMTYVARDVATGDRLGMGARVANEGEDPALAILCTPDGLSAHFVTGVPLAPDMSLADLSVPLSVGADGGAHDPFPVTAEAFDDGSGPKIRLLLQHGEAMGLVEYVLGAAETIEVSYKVGDDELVKSSFSTDSAAISIGAVLGECEGRDGAKSKG